MIVPAKEWQEEVERLAGARSVTMVLGGVDTGKTTLARYLIESLVSRGRRAALLDCDVGQSTLGPPTTIGLAIYSEPSDLKKPSHPVHLQFVGSTSPVGHLLPMIVGAKRALEMALESGAECVIIDTTGLISGPIALELKRRKIELLRPDYLIALEQGDELEPLLAPYRGCRELKVRRIRVSPQVSTRSAAARRDYRRRLFADYFARARRQAFRIDQVALFGTWLGQGRRLSAKDLSLLARLIEARAVYAETSLDVLHVITSSRPAPLALYKARDYFGVRAVRTLPVESFGSRLVSLNDAREALALGIIESISWAEPEQAPALNIVTPLGDLSRADRIHFGSLRLLPTGEELERVGRV